MSNKKHSAQEIAQVIFNELKAHEQEGFTQIYQVHRNFSYEKVNDTDTEISEEQAKQAILEFVTLDLENHNEVFLYTCRDNAQIIIEDFTQAERDHNDIYDAYEESNFPPLFIGYD